MFIHHIISFLSLCAGTILAKPLQLPTDESLSRRVSPDPIDAALMSNVSTTTLPVLNTSAANTFSINCNGALYGFNPNIADCEGAAQSIAPDAEQFIWQERHTGTRGAFFPLPFAVFGGELVAPSWMKEQASKQTVLHEGID